MSLRSPQPRQRTQAIPEPADADRSGPPPPAGASSPPRQGIARSIRLFRLFLLEQTEPEVFYAGLAEDAMNQIARHTELAGQTVVDVGGGAGQFTAAFRARGANCYLFEPDSAEMLIAGEADLWLG